MVSHRERGTALALPGVDKGTMKIVARSTPIGTPNRWLNPVAAAALDGAAEIAAVSTPELGLSMLFSDRGRETAHPD